MRSAQARRWNGVCDRTCWEWVSVWVSNRSFHVVDCHHETVFRPTRDLPFILIPIIACKEAGTPSSCECRTGRLSTCVQVSGYQSGRRGCPGSRDFRNLRLFKTLLWFSRPDLLQFGVVAAKPQLRLQPLDRDREWAFGGTTTGAFVSAAAERFGNRGDIH